MKKVLALQIDPLESLNFKTDSSLALGAEGQRRGYTLFCYQPENLFFKENQIFAKGDFVELLNDGQTYNILFHTTLNLKETALILIRQNPPFDSGYLANTYLLELLEGRVKIINSPKGIRSACEKVLPLQ